MNSKKILWLSYVLTAIPALMLLSSGVNVVRQADFVMEGFTKFGIAPHSTMAIGLAEFLSAVIYLIPRTAVLGAILVTGYLGGAVFAHLRIDDSTWAVPVIFGVFTWGGLYLRDARVRALIPFSSK
jgi:hypothetical protein